MGLRETMNSKPIVGVSAAVGLIAVAAFVLYWTSRPVGSQVGDVGTGLVHYTTDDGKTWFADSGDKSPEFKKDGKTAYRAHVYRDADGKEFVSCIERRSVAGRQAQAALEAMTPEQRDMEMVAGGGVVAGGMEFKRPGESVWYNENDPRAQEVLKPRSPSGKTEGLTFVQAK